MVEVASTTLQLYQDHIRQKLAPKGYAVWPPGRALQLGDVVTLGSGGDLRKQTDLRQLNIDLQVESGNRQPISATSDRMCSAAARAQAAMVAVASASARLLFKDKGAVVFEARDFQHLQTGNLAEVRRQVLELYREGGWQASWCLVDQLWWVGTGTIIVSETDDAEIAISAQGIGNSSLLAALADPNVHASVDVRSGSVAKVVGGRDFAALFTGMRMNFWRSDMRPISTRGPNAGEREPELVRLSLDEIDDAWQLTADATVE